MALKLSGGDLLRLLDIEEFLAQLEKGFRDYVSGRVANPLRVSVVSGQDWWGVMPSYNPELGFCVKVASVLPANRLKGVPTTRATVLFFDQADGGLRAIVDGTVLTGVRTAAATALFFKHARTPNQIFFFGAGLQARYHARILSLCFKIGRVNALSRSMESAEAFLRECEGMGLTVDRTLTAEQADTIIAATTSKTPVVERFGNATHTVVSVGAPTPDARELSDRVLAEASKVVVDTAEGCLNEAGDIVQTLRSGVLAKEKIVELGELLSSNARLELDRVVYKSVGSAFMDLYACQYFYRKALERGFGERIEL